MGKGCSKEMKNMVKCHQSALINDEFIQEPEHTPKAQEGPKGGKNDPEWPIG